jgi:hypothetical protein
LVAEDGPLPADLNAVAVPAAQAGYPVGRPQPADRTELTRMVPAGLDVGVACAGASVLVLQIKYRPGLWRLTVDGEPAAPLRADGVWTGVVLGPGNHVVRARARLPLASWLLAALALLAIPALAAGRRPR